MENNGGTIAIIVALIGMIATIAAAIIGAKWGKDNVTVIAQIDGKNVVLNNEDVKDMAKENEQLNNEILEYKKEIEELKSQSEDLASQLGFATGELNNIPTIEYKNLGLSIDGEEKTIDKNKSSLLINGKKYYSKDFVENLLPSNKSAIEKDNILYVGKIIKEKSNLFDKQMIDMSGRDFLHIEDNVKDTYGNIHDKAVIFNYGDISVTHNANREYTKLKCVLAVLDEKSGGGIIQIESEQGILYTSEEILSTTEPVEIDIPINYASSITIRQISEGWTYNIVTDAVLYNED